MLALGLALIAIGGVLTFTFTGDVAGIDVDILGIVAMTTGALLTATAVLRRRE